MRRAALKTASGPRFKRKTESSLSRNLIAIGKLAISIDYKGSFLRICLTFRLMTRALATKGSFRGHLVGDKAAFDPFQRSSFTRQKPHQSVCLRASDPRTAGHFAMDLRAGGRSWWFCKLGIENAIPDLSAFSRARNDRFREGEVFRRKFERFVETCIAGGLVGGEGLVVDASLIQADANKQRSIAGQDWRRGCCGRGTRKALMLVLWSPARRAIRRDLLP